MLPEGAQWILDGAERIQPGDLYRVREDSRSDYCDWKSADHHAGTPLGHFPAWHSRGLQFCRPVRPAAQPVSEPEWEPIIDENHMLSPMCDQLRMRASGGVFGEWQVVPEPARTVAAWRKARMAHEYEFRRRVAESQPTPQQPPAPAPDRGNKYHRTIRQTLPGDTHGCSVTIDVYDVLQAFGVDCPAVQHAVKKLLCAGLRGNKSAEQDISEAANSCRRAIELLECDL